MLKREIEGLGRTIKNAAWGGRRQNRTNIAKPRNTITTRQIASIKGYQKWIMSVIHLQSSDNNDKIEALRSAFEVWREMQSLQSENEMAEIVLSAMYRQGKIKDYLGKVSVFIEQIDASNGVEIAIQKGYYNYLSFIRQFVEDMQKKYSQKAAETKKIVIEESPENVLWFIKSECTDVSAIKDIPKAYEAVARLSKLEVGQPYDTYIKKDMGSVAEYLDFFRKDPNSFEEIEEVKNNLLQRISAIQRNITKGQQIYELIHEIMTDDWFEQFNPESEACTLMDLSKEGLKAFYSDKMQELQSKLSAIEEKTAIKENTEG